MSLYNNISDKLSSGSFSRGLTSSISSALGSAAGSVTSALGGGKLASAVVGVGQSIAQGAATGLVNKYLPGNLRNEIDAGVGAVGDLMRGDWNSAGLRLLDSGLLNSLFPDASGIRSQARYWATPTPLFGGISPAEAKGIYDDIQGQKLAKKNLWLLEVSSNLQGDMSQRFNMFATDVEYSPFILSGEKRRIGGAVVDSVQGHEPTEFRLTTMDDKDGSLKKWFADHHGAAAPRNGTVGLPAEYAIKIKVVHAYITTGSNRGGYEDVGWFRPANLDVSLSRREDGLEEIQMAFSQLDTFMRPT